MKRNYTFIPLLLLLIVAIVACSNNSSKSAADNDSEGEMLSAPIIRKAKGVYCSVPIGTAVLMPTRMPTRRSITALSWV